MMGIMITIFVIIDIIMTIRDDLWLGVQGSSEVSGAVSFSSGPNPKRTGRPTCKSHGRGGSQPQPRAGANPNQWRGGGG